MMETLKERYQILGIIGNGNFGLVLKVKNIDSKKEYACKTIFIPDLEEGELLGIEKEINILIQLECKYSVNLKENFHDDTYYYLILELCDNNLYNEIKKKKKSFTIEEIKLILKQLNEVFTLMKIKNIVHRDIKPQNLLIKYDETDKTKFTVKLSDYGLSKRLTQSKLAKSNKGTIYTKSPEIIKAGGNYDEKVDLWSLGVVIYFLYFKEWPFDGKDEKEIERKILTGNIPKKPEDPELNNLLISLLQVEPKNRLNWDQYLSHDFFKENKIIQPIEEEDHNNLDNKQINNDSSISSNNDVNIILIEVKVKKDDVNKNIFFLCKEDKSTEYREALNNYNTELFINFQKCKFSHFFKPEEEGIYLIELRIKTELYNLDYFFYYCRNIIGIDLCKFHTEHVSTMKKMFYYCLNLEYINIGSSFKTSKVTDMGYMFYGCHSIREIELFYFDTSNVENMQFMFCDCYKLETIDLRFLKTQKVTNIECMFSDCVNIEELDLSSFDTRNITNMESIFEGCYIKDYLDLSTFDMSNVKYKAKMFLNCHINTVYFKSYEQYLSFNFYHCHYKKAIYKS